VNEIQDRDASFEERLLAELRAVVEERAAMPEAADVERSSVYDRVSLHTPPAGGRRLAPRLALGGAAVAAVAAGVLAVSSGTGDTSSAFAVEPQGDGTVRVEISSLSDAAGLEKALAEAGVKADVSYTAAGMACREPRWHATAAVPGEGQPAQPAPDDQAARKGKTTGSIRQTDSGVVFSITPNGIGPDDTLVVTASPGPEGAGDVVGVQIAEGAVSPCDPVPAGDLPPGAVTQQSGGPAGPQQGFSQSGVPGVSGVPATGAGQSSN